MSNTKLVVVLRKDLEMPVGLIAAQATHVADGWMRNRILSEIPGADPNGYFTNEERDWMETPYVAILGVNCKEELEHVIKISKEAGLPVNIWEDTIQLQIFENKFPDVLVGCSIGPCDSDKLSVTTGCLPLF